MRTRPGSPQALALRRALRRAVRSESERAPLAPPPSGRGERRWHEISRPEMDDECLRRGRGARRREKQGKAQCGHGGWVRAAQSLRCSMRIHQESVQVCAYRLLITARGCVRACGCVCVRVGVWECGCVGVWGRGNKEAHLTNASLSSVGGLGPPKPPLTRHLVSSSERARQCDAARTRANARQAGRQGWRESVLSIHDPWCYTLSCNTCN